jgi:uncharacterized protein
MIFVDTGFFFALASQQDPHHARVLEVFASLEGQVLPERLLTSNHVVAETITLAQVRIGHDAAVRMGRDLYSQKLARIHWATSEQEKAAFSYLERHQDQKYSFVDCLSFVLMDHFGIRHAWAVDRHFTHRFIAHPGPLST